ncbi:MAG: cyclodeaminase/cyclohydrolase family protein [Clostridiales bacterium]|nr:cyclodeaminase/cyclohydrolase family protein [Clostridiales bacterium]MDD7035852.1 cyclodeaminase/cyclohydrolase family protein [Bacillota bacterium]MDY2920092.1 cyclodeaminase/cyclohydrolase family protein [Lentihominibacter sp.]
MKLIDMKLSEYLDVLISDEPAPGGGSVSALAGAQGAALMSMVCDLTISKKKYADDHDFCRGIKEEAVALYKDLSAAIDKDTDAYNLVAAAFKMPKGTDEEKAARKQAIADGTLEATKVPYSVMEMATKGLDIADRLYGHFNMNCASDYGVGVLNFLACVKGAWLNVKINLPGVKDEAFAAECEAKGREMMARCEEIAGRLYSKIEEEL